ncbi:MAG: TraR/DksA C4-type zinc finger protein [Anaerolineae bacterium]
MVSEEQQEDRNLLERERGDLIEEIERLRALLKTETDASTQEGDPDIYERERNLAFLESAEQRLEAVERAIRTLEKGTYGFCERCGRAIERERLEALPDTTLCLSCQREVERLASRARRMA